MYHFCWTLNLLMSRTMLGSNEGRYSSILESADNNNICMEEDYSRNGGECAHTVTNYQSQPYIGPLEWQSKIPLTISTELLMVETGTGYVYMQYSATPRCHCMSKCVKLLSCHEFMLSTGILMVCVWVLLVSLWICVCALCESELNERKTLGNHCRLFHFLIH